MIPYKQLSLADIFTDCQEKFQDDWNLFYTTSHKKSFFSLCISSYSVIINMVFVGSRAHNLAEGALDFFFL